MNNMSKNTNSISNKDILEIIRPDDALQILRQLVKQSNEMREKIQQLAMEILSDVDSESITDDVYFELDGLDVEELWERSGKTRHGYVDPVDEAFEMFEEVIKPFIDEMKRYQKMGLNKEAKNYCIGIIKGILKFDEESDSEFSEWAVDIPSEYLSIVVDEWKKDNPSADELKEIVGLIEEN
jgi:hypothetical protein